MVTTSTGDVDRIPGLVRHENMTRDGLVALATSMTQPSYTHDQVYGRFCTVHQHIEAPIDDVYDYLTDVDKLAEWTVSTRDLRQTQVPGRFVGTDRLAADTEIYLEVHADPVAYTVDFHCAWDQGHDMWMVYLFRLVDAKTVLGRPGTVVVWTNCRHYNYDRNPHPDRTWVGDFWPLFPAGHTLELTNLKAILEHRDAPAERTVTG